MKGSIAILTERARQIDIEGFSINQDVKLYGDNDQLLKAADCYLYIAQSQVRKKRVLKNIHKIPNGWPWAEEWWKPSNNPKRNLEKAGALIAAQWDIINEQEKQKTIKL